MVLAASMLTKRGIEVKIGTLIPVKTRVCRKPFQKSLDANISLKLESQTNSLPKASALYILSEIPLISGISENSINSKQAGAMKLQPVKLLFCALVTDSQVYTLYRR